MNLLDYYIVLRGEKISPTMAAVMHILDDNPQSFLEICEAMDQPLEKEARGAIVRAIQRHREWFTTVRLTQEEAELIGFPTVTSRPVRVSLTAEGKAKITNIKRALK